MTTDSEPQSLVTEEMQQRKSKWMDERVAPPIAASDIRRWAIAVYWPEKPPSLFWDEGYAKSTRWGGIIAPEDFNPFAWPVERETANAGVNTREGGRGTRGMNGGKTETFFEPMRPDDVISTRTRLVDWNERPTRLGFTLFTFSETEWHNQNGVLVKRRKSTGIRY